MIYHEDESTPIEMMGVEQVRAAADELLDSTTGDLTGEDAERFQRLTERAAELRRNTEGGKEIARMVKSGRATFDRGLEAHHDEAPVPQARSERDQAKRTLDRNISDGTMQPRAAETVERLMQTGNPQAQTWATRWTVAAGDPNYLSAFVKLVANPERGHLSWTGEEGEAYRNAAAVQAERAMSLTDSAGGFMVPQQLDPAILLSNAGSSNPLRQIARVVQTTGDVWNGVSSDGVAAHWYQEAAEVSDDSPTLAQPAVPVHRGSAWVPFSVEVEGDGANFVAEIGRLLTDAVDQLQARAFVVGSGTGEPTGFVTALTGTASVVAGGGTEALVAGDAYSLQNTLGPRWQANSAFAAGLPIINTFRQFQTVNGSLAFPSLQDNPPRLCGRAVFEVSNMDIALNTSATETNYVLALGDWSNFLIADRVGSTVELVPHLFGANRRPTGQRGFFLWFRVGSDVLVPGAFRLLNVATAS